MLILRLEEINLNWRNSRHYNIRKYSFGSRGTNIWNSLPDYMVEADSVGTFKSRLDKFWANQNIVYIFKSELTGTEGWPICTYRPDIGM